MQNFSIIKLARACFKNNKQTKRSWSRRSANPQQEKPKKTTERPNSRSAENQRKKKILKGAEETKYRETTIQMNADFLSKTVESRRYRNDKI